MEWTPNISSNVIPDFAIPVMFLSRDMISRMPLHARSQKNNESFLPIGGPNNPSHLPARPKKVIFIIIYQQLNLQLIARLTHFEFDPVIHYSLQIDSLTIHTQVVVYLPFSKIAECCVHLIFSLIVCYYSEC